MGGSILRTFLHFLHRHNFSALSIFTTCPFDTVILRSSGYSTLQTSFKCSRDLHNRKKIQERDEPSQTKSTKNSTRCSESSWFSCSWCTWSTQASFTGQWMLLNTFQNQNKFLKFLQWFIRNVFIMVRKKHHARIYNYSYFNIIDCFSERLIERTTLLPCLTAAASSLR